MFGGKKKNLMKNICNYLSFYKYTQKFMLLHQTCLESLLKLEHIQVIDMGFNASWTMSFIISYNIQDSD